MSTQTLKNFPPSAMRGVLKLFPLAFGVALAATHASAAVIDLSKPVSESLETFTGIYWKMDDAYFDGTHTRTTDASGNDYTGYLEAGVESPVPYLVSGVNLPGATGYGSAIRLTSNDATPSPSDRNSRIYYNVPSNNNHLGMEATDFTAGAWLSFSSLQEGAQQVMIMDRGVRGLNPSGNGGGWAFYLEKNANDLWRIAFTARDNTASSTVYSGSYTDLNINLDEWFHFAFAFDYDATAGNNITFYLNGVSLGSIAIDRNITIGTSTSARRFSVGERANSTYSSTFDGSVDDLFVTEGLHTFQAIPEPGSAALTVMVGVGVIALRRSLKNRKS